MTLQAAITAMKKDAEMWEDVANTTRMAAKSVESLTLNESELSWASRPTGLLDTYENLRAKAGRLLGEGTTELIALSETLKKVAKDYELSDETASQELKGVWEPRRK